MDVKHDSKRNTVTVSDGKVKVVYTAEAWADLEDRSKKDRDAAIDRALKAHAGDEG